jgi:hypothetical protein
MITSLVSYARKQVVPRWKGIIVSGDFVIALAAGVLGGLWGTSVVPSTTTAVNIAVALLTYSAVAFGFSLAGLTLVLTLPNEDFVKLLCATRSPKRKHDSYADLLFIFSWNATVHWAILVLSIVLLLVTNPQEPAFSVTHRIRTGIVAAVSVYALLQFLVTLITLTQVGSVYILHLRKEADKEKQKAMVKPQ